MPDLVQSRRGSAAGRKLPKRATSTRYRFSVALAALLGGAIGSYFLLNDAKLTAASGALCPPALLIIPAFLEVELRYPGLRHSWLGIGVAVGLIVVLNAALYALLMHYINHLAARLSRRIG